MQIKIIPITKTIIKNKKKDYYISNINKKQNPPVKNIL